MAAIGDAGIGADTCEGPMSEGAPKGSLNSCGECFESTVIRPSHAAPASWSLNVLIAPEPTVGDTAGKFLLDTGPDLGVCVYEADGVAGHACGLDLMTLEDCVISVCLPLCAIPAPSLPGGAVDAEALAAFESCESLAYAGACSQYATAASTDCEAVHNGEGTGAYDVCRDLVSQVTSSGDAGPATTTTYEKLIDLTCGGGDAGYGFGSSSSSSSIMSTTTGTTTSASSSGTSMGGGDGVCNNVPFCPMYGPPTCPSNCQVCFFLEECI
jgi:hypothetical protein